MGRAAREDRGQLVWIQHGVRGEVRERRGSRGRDASRVGRRPLRAAANREVRKLAVHRERGARGLDAELWLVVANVELARERVRVAERARDALDPTELLGPELLEQRGRVGRRAGLVLRLGLLLGHALI